MKTVYLDYAATTPVLPEVQAAVRRHLADFGNPSSLHLFGRAALRLVDTARAQIAELINADPSEIYFTSGGTESNNTIVQAFRDAKVLTSAIEHPSVLEPALALPHQAILPVQSDARIDLKDFTHTVKQERPALVSIMLANNELGTIQDIKQLATIAHQAGALFHTDAVQALGKIPIDVEALGVDFMTISAHKIGGLKGIGALYIKKGTARPRALLLGGHQERKFRAGTQNTLGIIAFGVAAKQADPAKYQKVAKLRDHLKARITAEIPDITINGNQEHLLPNLLNVSFAGAEGESTLAHLDLSGVAVSTGSACALGFPSHVLQAINKDPVLAHNSVRFSLGLDTTQTDLDFAIDELKKTINILRSYTSEQ